MTCMCIFCSLLSEFCNLVSFHSVSDEAIASVMGAVGAIEAISAAQNQASERFSEKKQEEAKQE